MNLLRELFPLSAKVKDVKSLVISILLYIVVSVVTGFVLGLLTGIPLIGTVIGFASRLIDLYCLGGMVVSIMILAKVF